MTITKKIKNNRAFVLLFAVTLVAIFLSIALGVAEVALRENNFSTSAKDTDNAFYAADTGIEQALYNDNKLGMYPDPASGTTQSWSLTPITGLGSDGMSCALVTVTKNSLTSPTTTEIIADGYNVGDSSCNSTAVNRVQRELETNY